MKFTATLHNKKEVHTEYASIGGFRSTTIDAYFQGFEHTLHLTSDTRVTAVHLTTGKQYIVTIEEIK